MEFYITKIGEREFLNLGTSCCIPIDTILNIELQAINGSSTNCVCITNATTSAIVKTHINYEDADAFRLFLAKNRLDYRW